MAAAAEDTVAKKPPGIHEWPVLGSLPTMLPDPLPHPDYVLKINTAPTSAPSMSFQVKINGKLH